METVPRAARAMIGLLIIGVVLAVVVVLLLFKSRAAAAVFNTPLAPLPDDAVARIAAIAVDALEGKPYAPAPDISLPPALQGADPVYVALRADGLRKAHAWADSKPTLENLAGAVAAARAELSAEEAASVTTIEICVTCNYRLFAIVGGAPRPENKDVGVLGVQFRKSGSVRRYAPTEMLARNLTFDKAYREALDAAPKGITAAHGFQARQYLVDVKTRACTPMERGNTYVPFEQVRRDTCRTLADSLFEWLRNNSEESGAIRYKYWPSRGEYSEQNNTVRQWLATVALQRWARCTREPAVRDFAARNLAANMKAYYVEEGELGLMIEGEQVKLGAVALGALAIVESHERVRYAREEAALLRMVDHLWDKQTGAFRTFYRPAERNDNQNFYPGEALLLWGTLYAETKDAQYGDRIGKAFEYYSDWHRKNKNPAFVPWHTQAYALAWKVNGDSRLKDFIFEMNDWLITTQQWDDAPYRDMQGRFFSPTFRGYGPPHASSTGVYMEGLVAAYQVAVGAGDAVRADRYRTALLRGLRNIMQLQFKDDVDMFYVSKKERVRGGIRTTEYNNELRVDNVAHNLLALGSMFNELPSDFLPAAP